MVFCLSVSAVCLVNTIIGGWHAQTIMALDTFI